MIPALMFVLTSVVLPVTHVDLATQQSAIADKATSGAAETGRGLSSGLSGFHYNRAAMDRQAVGAKAY